MSNSMNSESTNNAVLHTDNHDVSMENDSQRFDEKYRDQFTGLALDTGKSIIGTIKENASDYKTISEDKGMSSVEKALGKRKVLAADIGLGTLGISSVLGLVWLGKKVFSA